MVRIWTTYLIWLVIQGDKQMVIAFLTKIQAFILKLAMCHFIIVPIPSPQGDVYTIKWACNE